MTSEYTPVNPAAFGRVAVLMGGSSREREVSLEGGRAVLEALRANGVDAHAVEGNREGLLGLVEQGFDRVFNMLHGSPGEDGVVQGLLQVMGLAYTGSGVLASALGMDKLRSKLIWSGQGVPTPEYRMSDADMNHEDVVRELGLPLFVKPAREGSSIGMSRVTEGRDLPAALRTAREADSHVLIERCVEGPEYTAAIVGRRVLPMIRIEVNGGFYDYQAKYESDATAYHCPCGLSEEREYELAELSLRAFDLLGADGWGRVDFMLDADDRPWFLELNTNPGMASHSLLPMAASAAGWSFEELTLRILSTTLEEEPNHGRRSR